MSFLYTIYIYIQSDEIKKSNDVELFFIVVKDSDHYIGGTEKGTQFIEDKVSWLPYNFIGFLHNPGTYKWHYT